MKKDSIIFNHKQTEGLLKNGHITSRGKAYAEGNAHVTIYPNGSSQDQWDGTGYSSWDDPTWDASDALSTSFGDAADAADDFAESIDWIEVRIEELDEDLGKLNAQLENAVSVTQKNNKIDEIIAKNKEKMANLDAGADYYKDYANRYLSQIPSQFKDAAKNGAISITDFKGEANEEVVENIQKYREYAQKSADFIQQYEELKSEITDLAKQKFDNVATSYENRISLIEAENTSLETNLDLQEGQMGASKKAYNSMISNNKDMLSYYEKEAVALQDVLDQEVALGHIKVKSDEWYEMKAAIEDVKNQADECRVSIEDLALEKFNLVADDYDSQISKIEDTNDLLQARIDLMEDKGYDKVNKSYDKMIANTEEIQEKLKQEKKELIAVRDQQVRLGNIKVGGEEWLEMESAIADVDAQIVQCTADLEELADSKIDAIANQFENINSLIENTNESLQDTLDFQEQSGQIQSPKYYVDMMKNTKQIQKNLKKQRKEMQAVLDAEIAAGNIDIGDDNWYEHVNAIADVDAAIVQCTSDLEGYQNSINDIYWDAFDELISQFDYISNEVQGLLDIMSSSDMIVKPDNTDGWSADDVKWTDEGLASLGLHAQEMERAEERAEMYAIAIDDLTAEYKAGHYSESEYKEKLDELVQGQYNAIEAAQDEKDAIVDLNQERIDAVKEGINKQIEAYEKLIDAKKKELSAEKD